MNSNCLSSLYQDVNYHVSYFDDIKFIASRTKKLILISIQLIKSASLSVGRLLLNFYFLYLHLVAVF